MRRTGLSGGARGGGVAVSESKDKCKRCGEEKPRSLGDLCLKCSAELDAKSITVFTGGKWVKKLRRSR